MGMLTGALPLPETEQAPPFPLPAVVLTKQGRMRFSLTGYTRAPLSDGAYPVSALLCNFLQRDSARSKTALRGSGSGLAVSSRLEASP